MNLLKPFLYITLFLTISVGAFAQEIFFKSPIEWSSGCSGNVLAQVTKRGKLSVEGNILTLKMLSKACTNTDEYEIPQLLGIELPADAKNVYYNSKKRLGAIETTEAGFYVFFAQREGKYRFKDIGNFDKAALKGRKLKNEKTKFTSILPQIDAALKAKKEAEKAAKEKAKADEEANRKAAKRAEYVASFGTMYKDNVGKILFAESYLRKDLPIKDSPEMMVTEFELGNGPIYARAYFDEKDSKENAMNIIYSIDGVSVSSLDLNLNYKQYTPSKAQSASYFRNDLSAAYPLVSAKDRYWGSRSAVAEDAFRILLSKVTDKLVVGKTLTVKVEVRSDRYDSKNGKWFKIEGKSLAKGEIKMKITEKSKNVRSLLCRCEKENMQDSKVKAQIKKLFSGEDNVAKIANIRIISRDYEKLYRYKEIIGRLLVVEVQYLNTDGNFILWKGALKYGYNGSSYSDIPNFHKNILSIPISPTCVN